MHRNVHPDNVLISLDRKVVQLTGFECATDDGANGKWKKQGDHCFMAPEMLTATPDRRYCNGVDIWSFGILILRLLSPKTKGDLAKDYNYQILMLEERASLHLIDFL